MPSHATNTQCEVFFVKCIDYYWILTNKFWVIWRSQMMIQVIFLLNQKNANKLLGIFMWYSRITKTTGWALWWYFTKFFFSIYLDQIIWLKNFFSTFFLRIMIFYSHREFSEFQMISMELIKMLYTKNELKLLLKSQHFGSQRCVQFLKSGFLSQMSSKFKWLKIPFLGYYL